MRNIHAHYRGAISRIGIECAPYQSPTSTSAAPILVTSATAWYPLADGLLMQFPQYVSGAEYTSGDYWTFTAYFIDTHNLNSSPQIQLGSVKPGVLKSVSVSNDGGITWSQESTGFTRFLYSDVYASVSGDDTFGDGTVSNPYASLQRAVMAALSQPRGNFEYHRRGSAQNKTKDSPYTIFCLLTTDPVQALVII